MKKAITTFVPSNKKFNQRDFNKQMENFKDWEKKKQEKLAKLKRELDEKELQLLKDHPETNKEANLKFNTNPKNYTAVERLYTQDIKKRKDNRVILTKIYTPSFKPTIYTKRENFGIFLQQNNGNENMNRYSQKMKHNINEEEEAKEDIYNDLYDEEFASRKIKTQKKKTI